jgi:hypothetical protein
MKSMGTTRHQDLSRRPALTISRIVSRSLPASGDTVQAAEREQPEKESDKVRQRFLQRRQKANPSEAAQ